MIKKKKKKVCDSWKTTGSTERWIQNSDVGQWNMSETHSQTAAVTQAWLGSPSPTPRANAGVG